MVNNLEQEKKKEFKKCIMEFSSHLMRDNSNVMSATCQNDKSPSFPVKLMNRFFSARNILMVISDELQEVKGQDWVNVANSKDVKVDQTVFMPAGFK